MFIVREGAKTSQGGAFFGGGQSILIKTWGGRDELQSFWGEGGQHFITWFGGNKFCQSNFLSWGDTVLKKKLRCMHILSLILQLGKVPKTPRRGWCAKFGEGGDFIYKNFWGV